MNLYASASLLCRPADAARISCAPVHLTLDDSFADGFVTVRFAFENRSGVAVRASGYEVALAPYGASCACQACRTAALRDAVSRIRGQSGSAVRPAAPTIRFDVEFRLFPARTFVQIAHFTSTFVRDALRMPPDEAGWLP